jgi:hypothetical protein
MLTSCATTALRWKALRFGELTQFMNRWLPECYWLGTSTVWVGLLWAGLGGRGDPT